MAPRTAQEATLSSKPRRPAGLKRSARTWDAIVAAYDLRADELRLLEDACREADLIDAMQRDLSKGRLTVPGSMGQPVANPLIQELRAHRTALKGLWVALRFPDPEEEGAGSGMGGQAGAASSAARALANQRWGIKR